MIISTFRARPLPPSSFEVCAASMKEQAYFHRDALSSAAASTATPVNRTKPSMSTNRR
jgi:hypothetical protein